MSLDICFTALRPKTVFRGSITHSLWKMAKEAGIDMHLWRPEETDIRTASQLIEPLREGLAKLNADPVKFKEFEPASGLGTYSEFVAFVTEVLDVCIENPDAEVSVLR